MESKTEQLPMAKLEEVKLVRECMKMLCASQQQLDAVMAM
jgi:hypothetical protein